MNKSTNTMTSLSDRPAPHQEENGPHSAPDEVAGKINLVRLASRDPEPTRYFARTGVDPLAEAFERKTVVHAGMSGHRLEGEQAQAAFERIADQKRTGKSTAYVHVPFCETHCLYCGFYTTAYRPRHSAPYTDAVLAEVRAEQDRPAVRDGAIHALYLGGGTPTSLDPADLKRLILGLRDSLPLANDCEITVEGRVHGFGQDKMTACMEAGANRFSLGVQTFNTGVRRAMGRIADRDEVVAALEALQGFDSAAVVIDLIYGLPGQSMELWEEDLRTFVDLGLDGCDLYQLNVFPGGKLDQALKNGTAAPAADIPMQSRMFRRGVERMTRHRMRRLSISHWGRTTRERNIYNPLMKSRANCLAYGPGAGGSLQGYFYFIQGNFEQYMAARAQDRKPVVMAMEPPVNATMVRSLTGQLETGFLDLDLTAAETDADAGALFAPLLEQWEQAGLLRRDGNQVELTLAGQFWQVNITQALIDWHQHNAMES